MASYSSKNSIIDYDAIMKSIKIGHQTNPPFQQVPFIKSKATRMLFEDCKHEENHKVEPNYLTFNAKQESQIIKSKIPTFTSNLHSSIVYDDLSNQSCFQSVYRNVENISAHKFGKHQQLTNEFKFYYESFDKKIMHKKNKSQIGTPKQLKTNKIKKQPVDAQNDKQNNKNNYNLVLNQIHHKQHRYLSHTETSQKKINKKAVKMNFMNEQKSKSVIKLGRIVSQKP